ncbi:LPP20 family lipoprotein [Candidatus Latescibacterota bacterium]
MSVMRKFSLLWLVLVAVYLVGGCGGVDKGDVPKWYLNPPSDDAKLYGTGASEKMQSIEFAKKIADDNARQALAASIQTNIQAMIKQYMQQSGTMEEARAIQFAEAVSKSVIDLTLTGAIISKRDEKGGRMFSLCELSKDSMKNAMANAARDAAAEFSELKAKAAFDDLDKAIKNQ